MNQYQIDQLRECLDALPADKHEFAHSLLSQHASRGLSDKQWFWVGKLIEMARQPKKAAIEIGSLDGMHALFAKAKQHLKKPAIVLLCEFFEGAAEVKVAYTGQNSRYPGALHVAAPAWGGQYYGRITPEGEFVPSPKFHGDISPLIALLQEFIADPAAVAARHGRLTGKCCFCNSGLKDERSTAQGYGPVCAKRYDLPWGTKAAKSCDHHHHQEELAI